MAKTPTTQEQVDRLVGDLNDIRTTIERIHFHGYDRPHHDLHRFIQDNCRLLERQIHAALERVSVLNGFKGRIRGVPCQEWRDGIKDALRQLRKRNKDLADRYTSDDSDLAKECKSSIFDNLPIRVFSEGDDFARGCRTFVLDISPIRDSILKCLKDLEETDFSINAPESESNHAASHPASPAKDDETDGRFNMAALREKTGMVSKTINYYAKAAKVGTPGRGQRNYSWGHTDTCLILEAIIARTSETETRNRCQSSLDDLRETEKK